MDKYPKPEFKWFEGSFAQRAVQFLLYMLVTVIVSLAFAPFYK